MSSCETNLTGVSEGDREKLNIISKILNTDLKQESISPEVKLKCFAEYAMYLCAVEDKTSEEVRKLFSKNEELFDIVTKSLTNDTLKMTALLDMACLNASLQINHYDVPTFHTRMKSLFTKVVEFVEEKGVAMVIKMDIEYFKKFFLVIEAYVRFMLLAGPQDQSLADKDGIYNRIENVIQKFDLEGKINFSNCDACTICNILSNICDI